MTIQTQLCTFKTADNERLHGLLFTPSGELSDLALVFIHGVAMNFYLPPLAIFGQELAQRRYHCFVINTRGHDWSARAGNLTKFGGSAYENLEDCLFDFDGALDYLAKQGYRRFVLVGHSLGAIKSIIYQGTRRRADVVSIVSCSAPKQFYSERISRQPGFRETIEKAETMVAEGRGEELLSIAVGATPGIFSARTHLDKYGRDDRNDCRPYAKRIGCPLLTIVGSAEPKFFLNTRKTLSRRPGPTQLLRSLMVGIIFTIGTQGRLSKSSISGWRSSTVDIRRIMFPIHAMSWILGFIVSACLLLPCGITAYAAAAAPKLIIGYAAMSARVMPLWIAEEQGILSKYGIDSEQVFIRGAPTLVSGLASGDIHVASTGGTAIAAGHDLKILAAFSTRNTYDLVARPNIKRAEDLRGKRFGVTSIGGTVWMGALLWLEHFGLDVQRDQIQFQVIGDQTIQMQAMETGIIDAAVLDGVFSRRLKQKGYNIIGEYSDLKQLYVSQALVVQQKFLQQRADTAEYLLKAEIEAIAFSSRRKTNRPSSRLSCAV